MAALSLPKVTSSSVCMSDLGELVLVFALDMSASGVLVSEALAAECAHCHFSMNHSVHLQFSGGLEAFVASSLATRELRANFGVFAGGFSSRLSGVWDWVSVPESESSGTLRGSLTFSAKMDIPPSGGAIKSCKWQSRMWFVMLLRVWKSRGQYGHRKGRST